MEGFVSWAKEFEFYSMCRGKILKGFEQGRGVVILYIYI